jgi:uncharacterized membrane protein
MSRAIRLGGHPLHPAVVHFPIAAWTGAVGADVAAWTTGRPEIWYASQLCLTVGVVGGLAAMLTGALELIALARNHPAQDVATRHLLAMGSAWTLFVLSLVARGPYGSGSPPPWAVAIGFMAFAAMVYGGWAGGQLVYRHGVGMDESVRTRAVERSAS